MQYLNEFKVRIEHTRAEANEELIDTLHDHEMDDSARFDRMEREWENKRKDHNTSRELITHLMRERLIQTDGNHPRDGEAESDHQKTCQDGQHECAEAGSVAPLGIAACVSSGRAAWLAGASEPHRPSRTSGRSPLLRKA